MFRVTKDELVVSVCSLESFILQIFLDDLCIPHYGEFAISSLPQNFSKKMHHGASQIFQLIFAQTCKTSLQDVFFFSSRPVPGLWGPPGLISGIKLFQGNKFFKIRSVWFGEARLLIFLCLHVQSAVKIHFTAVLLHS